MRKYSGSDHSCLKLAELRFAWHVRLPVLGSDTLVNAKRSQTAAAEVATRGVARDPDSLGSMDPEPRRTKTVTVADAENASDQMDADSFQRTLATAHPLEPASDENVSKTARMAKNVHHIRGESELKFDVNEEAWPNADLAIHSSYEGALTGRPLADKVKAGDERVIRLMKGLQLCLWVKETDVHHYKTILLTGWAARMKENQLRSRCVLKDFATTVRDDIFAPTPSPLSMRRLLLYAAWFDLRVETEDLVCAFMQGDTSSETYARPPKGQARDGWIWRLHGAMNGMRTASRDFTEFLAGTLTEHMGFIRGKLER